MTVFHFRAFTASGDLKDGEINAPSREDAETALLRRGLTPFEWRSQNDTSPFKAKKKKPDQAQLAGFTREFATLEDAGIPLDQSLLLLAAQSAAPALREIATALHHEVLGGKSLSDALSTRPDVFTQDYIQTLRQAETIGKVGPAMTELADMLERIQQLRARVRAALVYPAILIIMAIISTGVVLTTLIPNIAPIFTDNGKPMPPALSFILAAEDHSAQIGIAFAGLIAAILIARQAINARPSWRTATDRQILKLPLAGPLILKYATARYLRSLGSLLKAGATMLNALDSANLSTANLYLQARFSHAAETIRAGAKLSAALRQIEEFPSVALQMIAIGEESGRLNDMLLRAASKFEQETQTAIDRAVSIMTPALTLAIATVVGGLILTVMDAVLSINDLATK